MAVSANGRAQQAILGAGKLKTTITIRAPQSRAKSPCNAVALLDVHGGSHDKTTSATLAARAIECSKWRNSRFKESHVDNINCVISLGSMD